MGDSKSPPGAVGEKKAVTGMRLPVILAYYAFCSGTLLIINKVALHQVSAPIFILFIQLGFSAGAMQILKSLKVVDCDNMEWEKAKKFLVVVVGFAGTLYTNMKVLQYANVETFITFRSSTPLALSIIDFFFLGRSLPSLRSWLSLVLVLLSCAGYMTVDSGFVLAAYLWLGAWYLMFVFDAAWVKHVCNTVPMTTWGRVYYNNAIGAALMLLWFIATPSEHVVVMDTPWATFPVWGTVALSCLVGLGMSHASYLLREAVTSAMAAVVGVLCKIITVIINLLIWDKHATPAGIAFLLLSVFAGSFYQQAPPAAKALAHLSQPQQAEAGEGEAQPLLKLADEESGDVSGKRRSNGGPVDKI